MVFGDASGMTKWIWQFAIVDAICAGWAMGTKHKAMARTQGMARACQAAGPFAIVEPSCWHLVRWTSRAPSPTNAAGDDEELPRYPTTLIEKWLAWVSILHFQ